MPTQDCPFLEKNLSQYLANASTPACYLAPSGMLTLTPSPVGSCCIGKLVAVRNDLMSIGTVEFPASSDGLLSVPKILQWLKASADACQDEAIKFAAEERRYDKAWERAIEAKVLRQAFDLLTQLHDGEVPSS